MSCWQEVEREVDDEKRAGRKRKITEMEYLYEAELEGGRPCRFLSCQGCQRQVSCACEACAKSGWPNQILYHP